MISRLESLRACIALAVCAPLHVQCAMTLHETDALGVSLTPVGAERAGNPEGTIPPWNGGMTKAFPGYTPGAVRPDPFADEAPVFSISAKNMADESDKLSDGVRTLMAKYPATYRIDVYRTHRTAAAPAWVYDNIRRNAERAELEIDPESGAMPKHAIGGIPFPIPKTGEEAIWNHILRWRGVASRGKFSNYVGTTNGTRILVAGGTFETQQPYYAESDAATFSGEHTWLRINWNAPPRQAGEAYLERNSTDPSATRRWLYIAGQRRVRQLPNACCDSPLLAAAGVLNFDEPDVWNARIDQYAWTLVGKKEVYIPYNANRTAQVPTDSLLDAHHLNPQHVRWELHRVWIVDAVLLPGKRNIAAKGRYYLDEDTWIAVLADRWNAEGRMIKTLWTLPLLMPEIPAVAGFTTGGHDLLTGAWVALEVANDTSSSFHGVPRWSESYFTPDALAASGVR